MRYNFALKILTICAVALMSVTALSAQTPSENGQAEKNFEITARYNVSVFQTGPSVTFGMKKDNKHTYGVMLGWENWYVDSIPDNLYSLQLSAYTRRYFHVSQKDIIAFYCDVYSGGSWTYNYETNYTSNDVFKGKAPIRFICGLEPGILIKPGKSFHIFLGPTLSNETVGLHAGLGF